MDAPRIIEISSKRLIGMSLDMSLSDNRTGYLWGRFMPRRREIEFVQNDNLYSVQVYDQDFLEGNFTPQTTFQKWAAVEVAAKATIPEGMEELVIPEGRFAVFIHRGPANTFPKTAEFIYGQWLPSSGYQLANKPHFEVMDKGYLGPEHPDSEEEVWVPIQ